MKFMLAALFTISLSIIPYYTYTYAHSKELSYAIIDQEMHRLFADLTLDELVTIAEAIVHQKLEPNPLLEMKIRVSMMTLEDELTDMFCGDNPDEEGMHYILSRSYELAYTYAWDMLATIPYTTPYHTTMLKQPTPEEFNHLIPQLLQPHKSID